MGFRTQSTTAIVASNTTLSGLVNIAGYKNIGMTTPNSIAGTVFLRGAFDQSSGNLFRVLKKDGSADWSVVSGASLVGKAVNISEVMSPFAAMAVELETADAANEHVFTISNKL